jgi:hypothetical protein
MSEYIKSMLLEMPTCAIVAIPMKLEIDALQGVTVVRHSLSIIEYKDADGNILMRHTCLGNF